MTWIPNRWVDFFYLCCVWQDAERLRNKGVMLKFIYCRNLPQWRGDWRCQTERSFERDSSPSVIPPLMSAPPKHYGKNSTFLSMPLRFILFSRWYKSLLAAITQRHPASVLLLTRFSQASISRQVPRTFIELSSNLI